MMSVRQFAITSTSLIVGVCLSGMALQASAATRYISDELTVPVRSGPSGGHRIVHRGLASGTSMEVLGVDEDAGFTHIRTRGGTDGWVRTQYLVSEPIAKHKLAAAQRDMKRAQDALTKEKERVKELTQTTRSQSNTNTSSQQKIKSLEAELAEIKRISAGAIEAHDSNQKLQEVNARLQEELDDLAESHARLQDDSDNDMLMIGGGLILLGLLAGAAIKARPQRSAWS